MPADPSKEPHDRIQRLEHRLRELETERNEMDLALRAAARGELTPAETYAAAGIFGLRDLNPGAFVLPFEMNSTPPSFGSLSNQYLCEARYRFEWMPEKCRAVTISRLWMEKSAARHFYLSEVTFNLNFLLLSVLPKSTPVPCELFARDFGSPRFNWRFVRGNEMSLQFINISDTGRHFRMLALGTYEPPVVD